MLYFLFLAISVFLVDVLLVLALLFTFYLSNVGFAGEAFLVVDYAYLTSDFCFALVLLDFDLALVSFLLSDIIFSSY